MDLFRLFSWNKKPLRDCPRQATEKTPGEGEENGKKPRGMENRGSDDQ